MSDMRAEDGNRPLLYVAAPVRASAEEERELVRALRTRAFDLGWAPIWGPALLGGIGLTEADDRQRIMDFDLSVMRRCEALVIVGQRITTGMELELATWLPWHRPVYLAAELAAPRLDAEGFWAGDRVAANRWSVRIDPVVRGAALLDAFARLKADLGGAPWSS